MLQAASHFSSTRLLALSKKKKKKQQRACLEFIVFQPWKRQYDFKSRFIIASVPLILYSFVSSFAIDVHVCSILPLCDHDPIPFFLHLFYLFFPPPPVQTLAFQLAPVSLSQVGRKVFLLRSNCPIALWEVKWGPPGQSNPRVLWCGASAKNADSV